MSNQGAFARLRSRWLEDDGTLVCPLLFERFSNRSLSQLRVFFQSLNANEVTFFLNGCHRSQA
jgi:hypothetical protein